MKNTNKAFTLVELIVVITILAILGTIAFISLQGYTQDAKNTKVSEDLANLTKKVSIVVTKDKTFADLIPSALTANQVVNTSTVNSGVALSDAGVSYAAGNIDFIDLGEKQTDFQDNSGRDYVMAYVVNKNFVKFEMAGNVKDQAGNDQVKLQGNYYQVVGTDVTALISWTGSTGPVANDEIISLY